MIKSLRVAIMLFAFCSGVLAIEPEQPSLKEAVSVASEGKRSSFVNNAASMIGLIALPIAFLIGNKLTSKKI
ncbi:MAG: hypothetical protein LBF33_02070, partial [Oscillospiraceae bacterium]|nr:hypothetical protein [Oscillospiraceae bacterium]